MRGGWIQLGRRGKRWGRGMCGGRERLWGLVLRADHWRVTPLTPPGPPFVRGGNGGAGRSLELRGSLVLRSDHWRVAPLTALAPLRKGRLGRCEAFAGASWELGASIGSLAGDAFNAPWPPFVRGTRDVRGVRWSEVLRADRSVAQATEIHDALQRARRGLF
jgi:hypothetical protein